MKVIESLWFTNLDGCIGIIVIEEDGTGDRKAYIGPASGKDEKADTEKILAWGTKFSVGTAERLLHFLKKEGRRKSRMATEVEILGHKAKIGEVSGQVKDGLQWMEDKLVVWLSFDEAVGSVLSFPIYLPVKQYEREEFLYNVRRRGEEDLKRILEMHEQRDKEREEKEQRKAELDAVAAEVQKLIE